MWPSSTTTGYLECVGGAEHGVHERATRSRRPAGRGGHRRARAQTLRARETLGAHDVADHLALRFLRHERESPLHPAGIAPQARYQADLRGLVAGHLRLEGRAVHEVDGGEVGGGLPEPALGSGSQVGARQASPLARTHTAPFGLPTASVTVVWDGKAMKVGQTRPPDADRGRPATSSCSPR